MDKKRLEELRKRVFVDYQEWDVKCSQDGFQEASPTGEMDADGKDLTALIDAEIVRQSATDDAVQVAIGWLEAEKESAQNAWERSGAEWRMELGAQVMHDELMASFDLAIQALCQMEIDLYPKAGLDHDADDWGNGYSRGYADGLQARQYQKPTDEAVQRAIEWVEETLSTSNIWRDGDFGIPVKQSIKLEGIRQTVITALQAYQPWVSVENRLPDGDVASVLIHTNKGGVSEGQYYPCIKSWKQFRWSVENADVTHWKPLPEPPKGE